MSKSFTLLQREEITDISELVQNHLVSLHNQLGMYFPDLDDLDYHLIQNPFGFDPRSLSEGLQDEFVELLNDSTAKYMFEVSSLQKFWSKSYPAVSKKCVESFLLFPSTYSCEQGFSSMCMMNKFRARLSVEHNLRVCLAKTLPRIDLLMEKRQAHPSHYTCKYIVCCVLSFQLRTLYATLFLRGTPYMQISRKGTQLKKV